MTNKKRQANRPARLMNVCDIALLSLLAQGNKQMNKEVMVQAIACGVSEDATGFITSVHRLREGGYVETTHELGFARHSLTPAGRERLFAIHMALKYCGFPHSIEHYESVSLARNSSNHSLVE